MPPSSHRPVLPVFCAILIALAPVLLPAADELRYPPYLTTDAQREAWRIGWPQWHGPHGNGTAIDCGLTLATAFKDFRLVWESEEVVPGWTPGRNFNVRNGFCTPVLAAGRVYVANPWPHGHPMDEPKQREVERAEAQRIKKAMPKVSDDIIYCFDALTGELLWKRVFEKRSPTLFGSGKEGGHFTMCVSDGRAYAFGGGNWIYCLDAVTGETVWENDENTGRDSPSNATAVVADGVLIYHNNGHVLGYHAATGKRLWDITGLATNSRRSATNKIWYHGDRELVLHETTCIDPRSGKVLWDIPNWRNTGNTTAVHGNYLVCAGTEEKIGPRCFRISPQGYELLWQLDSDKYRAKSFSTHCFYKGHAIMPLMAPDKIPGKDKRHWYFLAVDLETGEINQGEGMYKDWKYQPILAEGNYYYFAGRGFTVIDPGPEKPRVIDHADIKHYDGKRWTQDASPAYACGLMYIRTNDSLRCYDLRAKR
ncbi:MAG: PQQ-binding-like beta-propeller repeat protein [Planctomycetota bacterium]